MPVDDAGAAAPLDKLEQVLQQARGSLRGTFTNDLAAVLNDFPSAVKLREGLSVRQGALVLGIAADLNDQEQHIVARLSQAKPLIAIRDGKFVQLDSSISVTARVDRVGDTRPVLLADFASDFASGSATVRVDQATVRCDADFDALQAQLGQIVDLSDYQLKGQGGVTASVTDYDQPDKIVDIDLDLRDAKIGRDNVLWIDEDIVRASLDATINTNAQRLTGARIGLQSGLVTGRGGIDELVYRTHGPPTKVDKLRFNGSADLGKLTGLLCGLGVITNDLRMTGRALVATAADMDEAGLVQLAPSSITLKQLDLRQGPDLSVREEEVVLKASATIDPEKKTTRSDLVSLTGGFGELTLSGIEADQSGARPEVEAVLGGEIDLAPLVDTLRAAGVVTNDLRLAGTVAPKARIHLVGDRLAVAVQPSTARGLVVSQGGKANAPMDARVSVDIGLHLPTKALSVKHLALDLPIQTPGPVAHIEHGSLEIGDPSRLLQTLSAQLRLDTDLRPLLAQLGGFAPLAADQQLSGRVSATLGASGDEDSQRIEFDGDFHNLRFAGPETTYLDEALVKLNTEAALSGETDLALRRFELVSSPIQLNATGAVSQLDQPRKDIQLAGELGFDLERVGQLIEGFTGQSWIMRGKRKDEFRLRVRTGPDMLANSELEAGFHADYLELYGVEISDLSIPVELAAGIGSVELRSRINQGLLDLRPQLGRDDKDRLAITLPDDNRTPLTNFTLTAKLADQLFARMHPVFKGTTVADGRVNLHIDHLAVPLGAEHRNDIRFAGKVDLQGVRLAPNGLVQQLLRLIGESDQEYTIDNTDMTFDCRDGRVSTSDLRLKVKDLSLFVGGHSAEDPGSVGLDGSLRMAARIPLTAKMVPREVVPYIGENITIVIPIGGTVDRPKLDTRALTGMVGDLLARAAKAAAKDKIKDLLGGGKSPSGSGGTGSGTPAPAGGIEDQLKEAGKDLLKDIFK